MKILHALVGYLAITAMPFHPFAFASPLAAIYYDGYVDNTQQTQVNGALINHVLGNIFETCQTVTSHSLSDYADATQIDNDNTSLMKRVPGDIIEARDVPVPPLVNVPVVLLVIAVVAAIALSVVWIESDDPKRAAYTQDTISKMISTYPDFNWVICHSPHSPQFDGVEGTDYGHTHHELKISWGRTVGYNLYWARSGIFYRYKNGGYINWAYNGNIIEIADDGATIHFGVKS